MKKTWKQKLENPLYRFFSWEITKLDSEVDANKKAINKLVQKQEMLKRGRSKLVELRKEVEF